MITIINDIIEHLSGFRATLLLNWHLVLHVKQCVHWFVA